MLILFNKPFNVLTQFSGEGLTLKQFIDMPGVYPAGRLDKDSEGLLVLTDDGQLQDLIAHPRHGKMKTYLVQVDGEISYEACQNLAAGVQLKDGMAVATKCSQIDPPELPARDPPVRFRKNIQTSWIELILNEGRNRLVRRMTAAIGSPTLRLIRVQIGEYHLGDLKSGEHRVIDSTPVVSAHEKQRHSNYGRHVRRR